MVATDDSDEAAVAPAGDEVGIVRGQRVSRLPGRDDEKRPVEIGKVVGTFSDHPDTPQAESGSPGRFRGQWTLCR